MPGEHQAISNCRRGVANPSRDHEHRIFDSIPEERSEVADDEHPHISRNGSDLSISSFEHTLSTSNSFFPTSTTHRETRPSRLTRLRGRRVCLHNLSRVMHNEDVVGERGR